MSFSKESIEDLQNIAKAYQEHLYAISDWCQQISIGMGFDGQKDITFYSQTFSFIAYWNGPYQSENHECFSFDYEALLNDPSVVVNRLTEQIQQKEKKDAKQKREQEEHRQRNLYDELHKKFSNGTSVSINF